MDARFTTTDGLCWGDSIVSYFLFDEQILATLCVALSRGTLSASLLRSRHLQFEALLARVNDASEGQATQEAPLAPISGHGGDALSCTAPDPWASIRMGFTSCPATSPCRQLSHTSATSPNSRSSRLGSVTPVRSRSKPRSPREPKVDSTVQRNCRASTCPGHRNLWR